MTGKRGGEQHAGDRRQRHERGEDPVSQVGQRLPWGPERHTPRRGAWYDPAAQGRAVGSVRPRAGDLLEQDGDLVPEHPDLRVLSGVASREERQPAKPPGHEQVDEADEHERGA